MKARNDAVQGKRVTLQIPEGTEVDPDAQLASLQNHLHQFCAQREDAERAKASVSSAGTKEPEHEHVTQIERDVSATSVNKETLEKYKSLLEGLSCNVCETKATAETQWMLMVRLQVDNDTYEVPASNENGPDLCLGCFRTGCRLYPGKAVEVWVGLVLSAPSATEIFRAAKALFESLPEQRFTWFPSDVSIQTWTGCKVITPALFIETPEWTKRFRNPAEAFGLTTASLRCESNQMVEGTMVRDSALAPYHLASFVSEVVLQKCLQDSTLLDRDCK